MIALVVKRLRKQEYYDELVRACLDGRFPSGDRDTCYYRKNGKACAVGILIPEELYSKNYEGKTVDRLPIDILDPITPFGMMVLNLREVQRCHDNNSHYQGSDFIKYFLTDINNLSCFRDVNRKSVEEVLSPLHKQEN